MFEYLTGTRVFAIRDKGKKDRYYTNKGCFETGGVPKLYTYDPYASGVYTRIRLLCEFEVEIVEFSLRIVGCYEGRVDNEDNAIIATARTLWAEESKIEAIKYVKEVRFLGLKEAKAWLEENVPAPSQKGRG
jgi:hypothetical protein